MTHDCCLSLIRATHRRETTQPPTGPVRYPCTGLEPRSEHLVKNRYTCSANKPMPKDDNTHPPITCPTSRTQPQFGLMPKPFLVKWQHFPRQEINEMKKLLIITSPLCYSPESTALIYASARYHIHLFHANGDIPLKVQVLLYSTSIPVSQQLSWFPLVHLTSPWPDNSLLCTCTSSQTCT